MSSVQLALPPATADQPALGMQLDPNHHQHDDDDDQSSNEHDDDKEPEDYTAHSVHAEGVPRCELKLVARNHRSPEFSQTVFNMLQVELKLEGWSKLPDSVQSSISIHKVGGSLTNAVFFVSCPFSSPPSDPEVQLHPPPTVLLRVYGPSSGSLISRKHELHLLHTLSVQYGIGPLILGTFHNGRVEEYFESRPLSKDEMRDPRISRWIARRMRELHSVDLRTMATRADEERSDSARSSHARSLSLRGRSNSHRSQFGGSTHSPHLSGQPSSVSWSSSYSSSSDVSTVITFTERLAVTSPATYPHGLPLSSIYSREARSLGKKHSRDSSRSNSAGSIKLDKPKIGAWENITRWQREAEKVMNQISKLSTAQSTPRQPGPIPLSSVVSLLAFVDAFDLPRLIRETKAYRAWVRNSEKLHGKSSRVFSHNDTQYGNLLLRRTHEALAPERAHEQILVIDFEYASANPRAFDIANHFHEWCADYHHPSLSHSLSKHGAYPTLTERRRFYRAYLGDSDISHLSLDNEPVPRDEARLEEEVQRWSPASHAMWALWGIVQAQDDVKEQIERWSEGLDGKPIEDLEFDYLSYSLERIGAFRRMLGELGVEVDGLL